MEIMKVMSPVIRVLRPGPDMLDGPFSTRWGYDRGGPIDRYYIDRFMAEHAASITGHVLEVKDDGYTRQFGQGVTRSDILDVDPDNRQATVIADIAATDAIPDDTYDCVLVNETLQLVFDVQAAVGHLHRILKPGGALIVSVPTITPIDRPLADIDCWRFTAVACEKLFGGAFGAGDVEVRAYGNYRTCMAFLAGLGLPELDRDCLDETDPFYTIGVCVHARKALPAHS